MGEEGHISENLAIPVSFSDNRQKACDPAVLTVRQGRSTHQRELTL